MEYRIKLILHRIKSNVGNDEREICSSTKSISLSYDVVNKILRYWKIVEWVVLNCLT